GFVSGSYSQDIVYKKKASDAIVRVFSRHYERLFVNYQPFGAAFLYKLPSDQSELAIHQDWTIVDETKFVALNCWVPLNDIDATNGALHVLPGSHFDSLNVIRAPTLPFFFSGSDDFMIEQSEPMYVKAGEAVILNQSVVHYSPPNRSSRIRKAITAGVKSKGAPMIFYYNDAQKHDGRLEVFEMPEEFLISFADFGKDIGQRPRMGVSRGFIEYRLPQFRPDELKALAGKMRASAGFPEFRTAGRRKSFFERMAALFG
ncbi:MAG TPA: phytanoyl-CoA dioxygenase family protein, partial [Chitinophagales bacterium]|nr:phytanoyl-CoA dioxygenase family protein [Chitinophagales bacterium]